ncbi:MAG: DUF3786 domain-containing protein [Desulfatibacillaceae bacterium]|nr:DUF3786 domain-containing protein [Desulfatibacillaceae bacterium]
MKELKSPVDVLKIVDKSNCRKCGEPTCLAFATAVINGRRTLDECPAIPKEELAQYSVKGRRGADMDRDQKQFLDLLKNRIQQTDLEQTAGRIGASYVNGKLTVPVCGKLVSVDGQGNLYSEIHLHMWLAVPLLSYILDCQGVPLSGQWVSFREFSKGMEWYGLFHKVCEESMRKVADSYPELFDDMMDLFGGRKAQDFHQSDIAVTLYPLPLVPVRICYWKPGDGMDSSLNVFFDSTAEKNLPVESIYALAAGLARMFEKIALRHGVVVS